MSKCRYDLSEDCNDTDCLNCVLDKIRTDMEQAADKQFQIAMGVSDLNERYAHIQMENAYRHSMIVIDEYKSKLDTAISDLGMVEAHGICNEAKNIEVETMRKHQKIQKIYDNWNVDYGVETYEAMIKIGEVLKS